MIEKWSLSITGPKDILTVSRTVSPKYDAFGNALSELNFVKDLRPFMDNIPYNILSKASEIISYIPSDIFLFQTAYVKWGSC